MFVDSTMYTTKLPTYRMSYIRISRLGLRAPLDLRSDKVALLLVFLLFCVYDDIVYVGHPKRAGDSYYIQKILTKALHGPT